MANTTFRANSAVDAGGGMYLSDGATAKLTDSTFEDNSAGSYGAGGMYLDSGASADVARSV